MNGFKRASRRQAAAVGLAVLMGVSFLGCHTGPRLFSKKDRSTREQKQELAEKDKGKFIHRKKVRPESEYRHDERDEERVAKNESGAKSKSKPSDAIRKPSNDDAKRSVATRKSIEDESTKPAASGKPSGAAAKSARPAEQPQVARRETNRRPVTDLLDDSLFDEKLPTKSASTGSGQKSAAKPTTITKSKVADDEDPFKRSVVAPPHAKRPDAKVATVNFDDEDLDLGLDEEMDEEAEELVEASKLSAQPSVLPPKVVPQVVERTVSKTAANSQRKFLDDLDEPVADSVSLEEPSLPVAKPEAAAAMTPPPVKNADKTAKTVAGQAVIDRRQSVQQTVNDWRREMEADEPLEAEPAQTPPAPREAVRSQSSAPVNGHLSPVNLDEFVPPTKSQGAVLEGELIIDTSHLPSRFQRGPGNTAPPSGSTGRAKANSGAAIEITPDAPQNRPRPAGQISLQSLSDDEPSSGLTTADYQPPTLAEDLGSLPLPDAGTEAGTGPKLASLEMDAGIAPAPPELPELAPAIAITELPTKSRGWKRTVLVLSALLSAVGIGFALRRRTEIAATPIPASADALTAEQPPHDPSQWPRG